MASKYSEEEKTVFLKYIDKQLDKINIVNMDRDFLYDKMMLMYANPLINHLSLND